MTTTVTNVVGITYVDFLYFTGENFRNEWWAPELGNAHQTVVQAGQTLSSTSVLNGAQTLSEDVFFKANDPSLGIDPRFERFKRTKVYMWAAGVSAPIPLASVAVFGGAATIALGAVGLTINSTALACTSTTGVKVGAVITGAGIPAGTYVAAVMDGTDLVLSQAATQTVSGSTAVVDNTYVLTCTSTTGVTVGQNIIGVNIPYGASVAYVGSGTNIALSASATGASTGGVAITNGNGDLLFSDWLDLVKISIGTWTEV